MKNQVKINKLKVDFGLLDPYIADPNQCGSGFETLVGTYGSFLSRISVFVKSPNDTYVSGGGWAACSSLPADIL